MSFLPQLASMSTIVLELCLLVMSISMSISEVKFASFVRVKLVFATLIVFVGRVGLVLDAVFTATD